MNAIEVNNLNKSYANGYKALKDINLKVNEGEIFALLGPNGAGKSSLINIICGITQKSNGEVKIFGHDNILEYKKSRSFIGLVPQEIATDSFEKVINTLKFSRGLFNKPPSIKYLTTLLKSLELFPKRNDQIRTLSGGMKRRVMIAKALSHEPRILFLDEPTAGVDVSLRKSLWQYLNNLKKDGVTIFLTTHYIEEAERLADTVGIINDGKLIIIEKKKKLIEKLGEKKLIVTVEEKKADIGFLIKKFPIERSGNKLILTYDYKKQKNYASEFLSELTKRSLKFIDIETEKSNLEEIFINLVKK